MGALANTMPDCTPSLHEKAAGHTHPHKPLFYRKSNSHAACKLTAVGVRPLPLVGFVEPGPGAQEVGAAKAAKGQPETPEHAAADAAAPP